MEFNDIVTLILFLVFFLLPSVLRGLGRKKKRAARPQKKRFSLFGKLGESIREFIRDLEKQALEARQQQEAEKAGTLWDEMEEEEVEVDLPGAPPAPVPVEKTAPQPYAPPAGVEKKAAAPTTVSNIAKAEGAVLPQFQGDPGRTPLQNAVVWAEILGKPIALRKD